MNIIDATKACLKNKRVKRPKWKPGHFIYAREKPRALMLVWKGNVLGGFHPSCNELLAKDYEIVE